LFSSVTLSHISYLLIVAMRFMNCVTSRFVTNACFHFLSEMLSFLCTGGVFCVDGGINLIPFALYL